ncbi:hypothetical protein BGX31_001085 [Mortierella sp. GBA43]|nr:hypothetical protein BGX31_001085 [Mortierella sp. GBA43]
MARQFPDASPSAFLDRIAASIFAIPTLGETRCLLSRKWHLKPSRYCLSGGEDPGMIDNSDIMDDKGNLRPNVRHASVPVPQAASTPQLKMHQRTLRFMSQQPVYYIQVIEVITSAWIWASSPGSSFRQGSGSGVVAAPGGPFAVEGNSTTIGTFGDFAMAMPVP